ncbi:MAG: SDR family NAD(P)-dependent oxidoreductase [Actinomycetota bacterium]|nr:SDR family NAD(P)-dependent oxidoreductase [Actinomycetota bacterium]
MVARAYDSGGGVLDLTPELIDQHLAINVRGSLLLMRAFVEQLPAGTQGRIVIFVSGPPQNGAITYSASKGALEWIAYSGATELRPRDITVNALGPPTNQKAG